MSDDYSKTPEALDRLTDGQFRVTQEGGTEPAFRKEVRSTGADSNLTTEEHAS